jgi:hypothetical protein
VVFMRVKKLVIADTALVASRSCHRMSVK